MFKPVGKYRNCIYTGLDIMALCTSEHQFSELHVLNTVTVFLLSTHDAYLSYYYTWDAQKCEGSSPKSCNLRLTNRIKEIGLQALHGPTVSATEIELTHLTVTVYVIALLTSLLLPHSPPPALYTTGSCPVSHEKLKRVWFPVHSKFGQHYIILHHQTNVTCGHYYSYCNCDPFGDVIV